MPPSNKDYHNHDDGPKLKKRSVTVNSVLLVILGAIVVGVQTYVFVTYKGEDFHPNGSLIDRDDSWRLLCNGLSLASGAANLVIGIYCLCLVALARSRTTLAVGVVCALIGAAAAAGATVVSSMEVNEINGLINTGTLFWLEVCVAAVSALSFAILDVQIVVFLQALCRKSKTSTGPIIGMVPVQVNQQPEPAPVVGFVERQQQPPPEVPKNEPVVVEVQRQPSAADENDPRAQARDPATLAYAQRIRDLSPEQLEQEMEHILHAEFLRELRREMDRRKRAKQREAERERQRQSGLEEEPERESRPSATRQQEQFQPPAPDY